MTFKWQCWRTQKALGPYRDGELTPPGRRAGVERHLAGCRACRSELAQLDRMAALLRTPVASPSEAVWETFWPQVRARLAAVEQRPPLPWIVRWWPPLLAQPRLAMGSVVLALALVGIGTWQGIQWMGSLAAITPQGVVVRSVESADPNSTVMVFSHPDQELTVVWVFGLDRS